MNSQLLLPLALSPSQLQLVCVFDILFRISLWSMNCRWKLLRVRAHNITIFPLLLSPTNDSLPISAHLTLLCILFLFFHLLVTCWPLRVWHRIILLGISSATLTAITSAFNSKFQTINLDRYFWSYL